MPPVTLIRLDNFKDKDCELKSDFTTIIFIHLLIVNILKKTIFILFFQKEDIFLNKSRNFFK